jgi:hypothetical protein
VCVLQITLSLVTEWLISRVIRHRDDVVDALHLEMQSDLPPRRRAHSTTDLTPRINTMCTSSTFPALVVPYFHRGRSFPGTTVLCQNKIWVFGGNRLQALNSVWTLGVGGSLDRMKWERAVISGRKWSSPRGYYTANFVRERDGHRWR